MKVFLKRLRHSVREQLGLSEFGVQIVSSIAKWGDNLVRDESVICIEAYPRSANTYSVAAYQVSQPNSNGHIGRHSHLVGNVKRAISRNIPVLIVIREPKSAAASLRQFSPWMTMSDCLKDYVRFYKNLMPHRANLAIVDFKDVVDDFQTAISVLNAQFDANLQSFVKQEMEQKVIDLVEEMGRKYSGSGPDAEYQIARPSAEREKNKQMILKEFELSENAILLSECEKIYKEFINR